MKTYRALFVVEADIKADSRLYAEEFANDIVFSQERTRAGIGGCASFRTTKTRFLDLLYLTELQDKEDAE